METIEQIREIQVKEMVTEEEAIKILIARNIKNSESFAKEIKEGYEERKRERGK